MEKWYIENLNNPKPGKYPAYEINISSKKEANICTVWYSDLFSDEAKKNALLISKAPEMFEMLKELMSDDGIKFGTYKRINKLIKDLE